MIRDECRAPGSNVLTALTVVDTYGEGKAFVVREESAFMHSGGGVRLSLKR